MGKKYSTIVCGKERKLPELLEMRKTDQFNVITLSEKSFRSFCEPVRQTQTKQIEHCFSL